jgi:hypothetical protein
LKDGFEKMKKITKLTFSQEGRKVLSPSEALSWKESLEKILKLGFEHEFNLNDSKGECRGDSFLCPCSHPLKKQRKCYSKCLLGGIETCQLAKDYGECPGVYCIEFVSPCHTCAEAVRDCAKCDLFEDPEKKPNAVRKRLTDFLRPTNDVSNVGKTGALQVTTDGSLMGEGGVEIPTVGRRVNFNMLLEQAKNIINNVFLSHQLRTSLHLFPATTI